MYILYESASGYALFETTELNEEEGNFTDLAKFGKMIKLVSFQPFKSAAHALENINDVSEGKKGKAELGVQDKGLANSIKSELGYSVKSDAQVLEFIRGIRLFSDKLLKGLKPGDLDKAQLGLGHSYSRAKVKFNVNRVDNMIIQAINLLDQLDKDVNTFSMRVRYVSQGLIGLANKSREWYSWHFPELVKIVSDNQQYARLAKFIKNKSELTEEHLEGLEEITGDPTKAKMILDAARASMGTDISDVDMENIEAFADRVISLADYRKKLHGYLNSKMHQVAPNLSALIGEVVGARLISHAGSLTNLSKYPASTVQILGAEKALFRALKTKGNTPKYGLIYHSTFIGRAAAKNKGRISRFLANKCSIASRIDSFLDKPTSKFGEVMRDQVEERLKFYETGDTPRKNADVMKGALESLGDLMDVDDKKKDKKEKKDKKDKKRKSDAMEVDTPVKEKESKESKKSKKEKKSKE